MRLRLMLCGSAIAAALGCQSMAPLEDTGRDLPTGDAGSLTVRSHVMSLRELRFRNVVPQQRDYSCGAAALATLLRFHYNDPVEESKIIDDMLRTADLEKVRRSGFSLLDLKHYAEARGYETKGFRIKPEVLERLAIPSITLINTRGYAHFVVLRGARDGTVYLADPALGQRQVPKSDFLEEWEGVVFFVAATPAGNSPLANLSNTDAAPIDIVQDLDYPSGRPLGINRAEF